MDKLKFYKNVMKDNDLVLTQELNRQRSALYKFSDSKGNSFYGKQLNENYFSGILNDISALKFLKEVPAVHDLVPQIVYADPPNFKFVMEDLGEGSQIDKILLDDNALAAEDVLLEWTDTLSKIHGNTIGLHDQYMNIRESMGFYRPKFGGKEEIKENMMKSINDISQFLQINESSKIIGEINHMIKILFDEGPLLGLNHWDPCPDNCLKTKTGVKIFDFETSSFANVFLDAFFPSIRYPSCWCVGDFPNEIIQKVEASYRKKLSTWVPSIGNEDFYQENKQAALLFWMIHTFKPGGLKQILNNDENWGICSIRQRIMKRLSIIQNMESGSDKNKIFFPELQILFNNTFDQLSKVWGDLKPMPYYKAFGGL